MHSVKVLNLLAWIHSKAQEVTDLRHLGLETHQFHSPKAPEVEKTSIKSTLSECKLREM